MKTTVGYLLSILYNGKNIIIYTSLKISLLYIVLFKMPLCGKFIEANYYLRNADKKILLEMI